MHLLPDVIFIDKQGMIRAEHLGATDAAFFAENMERRTSAPKSTRSSKEPVIQLPRLKRSKRSAWLKGVMQMMAITIVDRPVGLASAWLPV